MVARPLSPRVNWTMRKCEHSSSYSAEVKNTWSFRLAFFLSCIYMEWCLTTRTKFSFLSLPFTTMTLCYGVIFALFISFQTIDLILHQRTSRSMSNSLQSHKDVYIWLEVNGCYVKDLQKKLTRNNIFI
jgi:hypothetical protein